MNHNEVISQNKRRGTVFVSWVILFFVMVLIAFLIMGIYFYSMTSTLHDNLMNYNDEKTKQISIEMDASATRLIMSAVNLANHRDFQSGELLYSFDLRRSFISEIAMQLEMNRDISEISIYLPQSNEIISSNSIVKSQYFYQSRFDTNLISFEDWEGFLRDSRSDYFCMLPFSNPRGTESYKLTYVLNDENGNGKIMVTLNANDIIAGDSYFSGMLICDEADNFFEIYTPNGVKVKKPDKKLPEQDGLMADNEESYISCITSTVPGLRYVIFTQKELLNKNLNKLQLTSVVYLLVFLIVGLILAWYFAFRQYKPLSRILDSLKTIADEDSTPLKNEYTEIESRISNILEEKAAISREARKREHYMKERAAANLLNGKSAAKEIMETLKLKSGIMCVVRVMFSEEQLPLFENDFEMMQFGIKNIADEIFSQIAKVSFADIDGSVVMILSFENGENPDDVRAKIRQTAESLRNVLSIKLQIETETVISRITENVSVLPEVYREVLEVSFMRKGFGEVVETDELISKESQAYNYSVQTEMKIITLVKNGDYDGADEIISNEINEMLHQKNYSINLARCFMVELAGTIMKAAEEIRKDGIDTETKLAGDTGRLFSASSIKEMEMLVRDYLKEVCEFAVMANSGGTSSVCEEIKKYIKENYADSEMNVNELARKFYLNPTYLSTMFKKNTGVKLLEFINKVRVAQAKKLMLSQPELSVEEIAEKTGFSNSRTFRRIFQKYENSAPSKFLK